MINIFATYAALGAFAGVLAGLLGVGGGLVIVPVLVWLFQEQGISQALQMHLAIGTSLATIVATSLSSIRAHHRRGAVLWPVVKQLVPGILLGTWIGAQVVHWLPAATLHLLFGCFELLVAAQLALELSAAPHRQLPNWPGMIGAGTVIGYVSALVGIGGGVLTVPFLTWSNIPMRQAVATSAACGFPIALAGSLAFTFTGWSVTDLPAGSWGYVYSPALLGVAGASVLTAPLGAWLAHNLPSQLLKRFFSLFLVVLGIRMLLT